MWTVLLALLGGDPALANPYRDGPVLGDAPAQPRDPDAQPFTWTVPSLAVGEVEVVLAVPEGHAVYRDMIAVRAEAGPVKLGEPVFPEAELGVDPSNPEQYRALYSSDVKVRIPFEGSGDLVLVLEHQGCRKGLCWPITSSTHTVKVVSGG